MKANAEIFLSLKWKQISSEFNTEGVVLFKDFYANVMDESLKGIFSFFHSHLNELFSFMNQKKSSNGHYNAAESRGLIEINRQLSLIHATLNNDYKDYSFEIDDHYKDILDRCKSFLSSTGGSSIPEDFPEIDIIEHKPIFNLSLTTEIQRSEVMSFANKKIIGSGSYANVYKYKDPHYNLYFVIKSAKKDLRPDELERFKNEFNDLKYLDSPFIIKAYHYNDKKNEYTMELADCTLEEYISKNNSKLSFNDRRILVIQLLKAFEYIHFKELLHRDISYQNILIKNYDDGSIWVKVSDFGLAKRPLSTLTRENTEIKGSINDISDLNAIGFKNYEIRHETYALAQVIYYILTGRKARYEREENNELKTFILRAISPHKENRYTSVNDMMDELINVVFPSIRSQ